MAHKDGGAPLSPEDIPPPNADFEVINEFGHSFDGYEHAERRWPDQHPVEACCQLDERVKAALAGDDASEFDLDDLRAALFVEMRQARLDSQFTDVPSEEGLAYYHRLIECIRGRVERPTAAGVN